LIYDLLFWDDPIQFIIDYLLLIIGIEIAALCSPCSRAQCYAPKMLCFARKISPTPCLLSNLELDYESMEIEDPF